MRAASGMRKIDELFGRYDESHRNPTNKAIHWICVPLITWSLLAALWAWTPLAAYALIALATAFYVALSLPIAIGMLVVSAMILLTIACSSRRGSDSSSVTRSKARNRRSAKICDSC
jgi:uncharacterized membrane protein YGL010W